MIRPGVGEQQLSDEINATWPRRCSESPAHWHRRIVRAGENTLHPFQERPPDRVIADGDIVFLDFGPIFEDWEADFGRTFVLGDDPHKLAVRDALPRVWQAGRDYFDNHPDVTGAELYRRHSRLARRPRVSSSAARSPAICSGSFRTRRSSGTGRRVVHHARIDQADAAHATRGPGLPLDSGDPSERPGRAASVASTSSCSIWASDGIRHAGELLGHRPQPALPLGIVRLLAGADDLRDSPGSAPRPSGP